MGGEAILLREIAIVSGGRCNVRWDDGDGQQHFASVRVVSLSDSGLCIECPEGMQFGGSVYIEGLTWRGMGGENTAVLELDNGPGLNTDHYEVLQISPNAEMETIHRVYRIMAARFHPDNPETGNLERFLLMRRAYEVLSDPQRRAEYDAERERQADNPDPIFGLKDFVIGIEAENNRRIGVLSVLYSSRRLNPDHPGVSVLDLEKLMGFPREHLQFTMWYLRAKKLIAMEDGSTYALTGLGADYVEANAPNNALLEQLLRRCAPWTTGTAYPPPPPPEDESEAVQRHIEQRGRHVEAGE